ncbi:MAG TPA: acylphosphatase [Desulfomonilaceae bacterium]|nr:acylphosphatase [Desulfomonilaceae bacterium]
MTAIRRRVLISGIVQGVAFRYYTRAAARDRGVNGWVRNLPDGRVEAVFEGEQDTVNSMVTWCRKGPSGSQVDDVRIHEERPTGEFTDFEIRYTGWGY